MPKVGADAIALVVNVEVRHTMVIVGSATPGELTFSTFHAFVAFSTEPRQENAP